MTQANAGAANEMAATSGQLSGEAVRLNERARFFTLEEGLGQTVGVAHPAQLVRGPVAIRTGVETTRPVLALQARAERFAATRPVTPSMPHNDRGFDLNLADSGFERMSR